MELAKGKEMGRLFVDIAVKGPFYTSFTYYTDSRYEECLFPGQMAQVSFGKRTVTGYIRGISRDESCHKAGLKPLLDIVNINDNCDKNTLAIIDFITDYYHAPCGAVYPYAVPNYERITRLESKENSGLQIKLTSMESEILAIMRSKKGMSPAGLKKKLKNCNGINLALSFLWKRGLIEILFDFPEFKNRVFKTIEIRLTGRQQEIYSAITSQFPKGFSSHLIYGITGSGKTYIYMKLIQDAVKKGGQALLLVPEIGISMHLEKLFREFIPNTSMIHSSLGKKDKRHIFQNAANGLSSLVIGPRSALFIPFRDLKLIIIDEEHDKSYKQENVPCYNARDVAVYRAMKENIPVILGSATPSLESYYNARIKGKYSFYELRERYGQSSLPEIITVDLRQEKEKKQSTIISSLLIENLQRMKQEGDQGIIFINRRGFYSAIICLKCGESIKCRGCSVSMSYHSDIDRLVCHQCGKKRAMPEDCPYCGSQKLTSFGFGTEQVAELIGSYIPGIRILRFDSDKVKQREKDSLLKNFADHAYDLIVGTQMITKGFDFPKVNLVGVIQADENLYMPDFRGAERTYQIISQVSGRSGRREKKGMVIIQTYMPEHYSIAYSLINDYYGFAEKELVLRKRYGYPPYKKLCMISASGYNKIRVMQIASRLYDKLCENKKGNVSIIGPVSAFIEKRKNQYRWNILLQGNLSSINSLLSSVSSVYQSSASTGSITVDMDPYSF